ncbi:helix-turn-helix domain-containing protein [Streptomyces aureus]|uniref:Transposase family protein n=1 Tax=Streptomyces aureus TaxID=193461 RepID=A0ABV4SMU0_9ACTN
MIAELVAEIGPLWKERHQAALVSRPRRRAIGAGAKYKLVFVDRLLATLVNLRNGATHDVLTCWFGVDRSTITRAIGDRCWPSRAAPSLPVGRRRARLGRVLVCGSGCAPASAGATLRPGCGGGA